MIKLINTQKMTGRITEKGFTIQTLAPKIPCSPYTLGQKIANKTSTTIAEAEVLCKELEIKESEFAEFFLYQKLQ